MHVYPDYYKEFSCIAGECKHNCCIGWEIDIDGETAEKYKNVGGELGKRLKNNISKGENPHFILGERERCPFLNGQNLCDIICELGEGALCAICAEHPRFHNELPDRIESGLGLTCEAAGRIILGKKSPLVLIGEGETDDEIIILRNKALAVLINREKRLDERISHMLMLVGGTLPKKSLAEWAEIYLDLERLDDGWTKLLEKVRDVGEKIDFSTFNIYMAERTCEFEQLAAYFIYRHFANAPDFAEAAARGAFAVLSLKIIAAVGAVILEEQGDFTFDDMVELCRKYSSEIEYSDENLYALLDILNPDF